MSKTALKRNPQVELIRIIACLIMLMSHCNFFLTVTNQSSYYKLFLSSFLGDAVAIFWMITGFFLLKNSDYTKLWKHTFKKIILPVCALYLVYLYLEGWILGGLSLAESMAKTQEDYRVFFQHIIRLSAPESIVTNHTWYVMVYLLVILISPALKAIADKLNSNRTATISFLVVTLILYIINDSLFNTLFEFGFHGAKALIPASICVIIGNIIYTHRNIITSKKFIILAPMAFIGVNLIRAFAQFSIEHNGMDNARGLFTWYTSFSILCSICVIAFAFSSVNPDKNSVLNRCIVYIGKQTYGIYLVHAIVQEYLMQHGMLTVLNSMFLYRTKESVANTIILLLSGMLVFVISFMICVLISLILKLLSIVPKTLQAK